MNGFAWGLYDEVKRIFSCKINNSKRSFFVCLLNKQHKAITFWWRNILTSNLFSKIKVHFHAFSCPFSCPVHCYWVAKINACHIINVSILSTEIIMTTIINPVLRCGTKYSFFYFYFLFSMFIPIYIFR